MLSAHCFVIPSTHSEWNHNSHILQQMASVPVKSSPHFPQGNLDFLFDFAPVVAVGVPVCASVGAVTAAAVAAAAAPNFDLFIILNCSKDVF